MAFVSILISTTRAGRPRRVPGYAASPAASARSVPLRVIRASCASSPAATTFQPSDADARQTASPSTRTCCCPPTCTSRCNWYLWYLGTPERDPVAPFLRRAGAPLSRGTPLSCPDGGAQLRVDLSAPGHQLARSCDHIGVHRPCARLRGRRDAAHLPLDLPHRAEGTGDLLAELFERHGPGSIRSAKELIAENAKGGQTGPSTAAREEVPQQRRRPRASSNPP